MGRRLGLAAALAAILASACAAEDPPCASLEPGDVVVSEVMAKLAGSDAGKEWIELFNATGRPLSLDGLTVWTSSTAGTGVERHALNGAAFGDRAYLVLGGVLAEAKPAWIDYAYGADLGLNDKDGKVWLTCGGTVIDEAAWGDVLEEGVSLQLSSDALSATANDDPGKWCLSTAAFAAGAAHGTNKATPGASNAKCDAPCSKPPAAGDLTITEIMADPDAVGDSAGEWIEVLVNRPVDLAGVDLATINDEGKATPRGTVPGPGCRTAAAGTYVVLAKVGDAATNGGLPEATVEVAKLSLTNDGATLTLAYQGTEIDRVEYGMADSGVSRSRDAGGQWCKATAPYGFGDLGTPGAANPACVQ